MNYIQLINNSIQIIQKNKIVWVFGLSSFLQIAEYFLPTHNNLIFYCGFVFFILAALAVLCILVIGSTNVIYSASLGRETKFLEVWSIGKSNLFKVVGFFVISIPILVIIEVPFFLLQKSNNLSPFNWILYFLASTTQAYLMFGFCAIVINKAKIFRSVWSGLLIFLNNFIPVFIITGGFYLIRLLIIGVTVAFIAVSPSKSLLPISIDFSFSTYLDLISLDVIRVVDSVAGFILTPLETVLLILLYLKSMKEIAYPGLAPIIEE